MHLMQFLMLIIIMTQWKNGLSQDSPFLLVVLHILLIKYRSRGAILRENLLLTYSWQHRPRKLEGSQVHLYTLKLFNKSK